MQFARTGSDYHADVIAPSTHADLSVGDAFSPWIVIHLDRRVLENFLPSDGRGRARGRAGGVWGTFRRRALATVDIDASVPSVSKTKAQP